MARLAILHPTSLLGLELRDRLDASPEPGREVTLLATREEEVGVVSEVGGAAALVQRVDDALLAQIDLVFLCDDMARSEPFLARRPPSTTAVVLALDAPATSGTPLVAGVNLDGAELGEVLLSPHPAVLALAHLLHPLLPLGLVEVVASVLQPASVHSRAALDEIFAQTRSILSFAPQTATSIFGRQLAFNLLPTAVATAPLVAQLQRVLGEELAVSLQLIQAGVFHGVALSVWCRLERDPGVSKLRQALATSPRLELVDEAELLGPIDAATRAELLVGRIEPDASRDGAFWLWAVMDHLVLSTANGLEIAGAKLHAQATPARRRRR